MDQSPLVLLCAASGTGLSEIAGGLSDSDENSDAKAGKVEALWDLEASLCESFKGDTRIVNSDDTVPSMGSVVTLPRDELYQSWNSTCDLLMDDHVKSKDADLRVLSLHLTWFDSNTGEFFSPVDVRHLDREDCKFDHVVILIDDIFDMYSRLQNSGGLYSQSVIENKTSLIAGLRGLDLGTLDASPELPNDAAVRQRKLAASRLRLEAKELALGHLMSWRRSEMIYAENIARILGANFTILGTKHSKAALRHLAESAEIPRIYLSHRISEVRRLNKKSSSLPEELGEWGSVVGEVNDLHFAFARGKQLLINPTAIDELRFATIDQHNSHEEQTQLSPNGESASDRGNPDSGLVDYRGRESALLAARWELPEPQSELLWVSKIEMPDGSIEYLSPEHTEAFTEDLSPVDDVALSVTRSLESRNLEEFFAAGMFTGDTRLYAVDFRYVWAPTGNSRQKEVLLQGEYFWREEEGVYTLAEGDEVHEERLDGGSHGWYAQGVFKFSPKWRIGARYSQLYSPEDSGIDHDPYAVAVMGDWSNSEFSRIRLQYNYEKLEEDLGDNQFLLQYIMSIGAHAAHKY